jgi:pimeloyl-ACP methyl ester carboxylesterase
MSPPVTIQGPEPIELKGHPGLRYRIHHLFPFVDNDEVNERLSHYPLVLFLPPRRTPDLTPVLIGLQGMAAPYEWSAFLIPELMNKGIACVLFDTPFGGERSLLRTYAGDVVGELAALLERGVRITSLLVANMMEAVARDFRLVLRLLRERHGLIDPRLALFGVSLGTLLASFTFMRDGIGQRLLGTIGHADLPHFAASYAPRFTPLLSSLPVRLLGLLLSRVMGRHVDASLAFVAVLNELIGSLNTTFGVNPMDYADRVKRGRRVRFLVGRDDPLVYAADAQACAARFPEGACYVVPGMGHGGVGFEDHVRYFVATQLGDWGA